jgi:MFS family permease
VVNTTASRWFVRKRGLVVGITSSGGGLGVIAVAPLATFLISTFNWRVAFVVLGSVAWFFMGAASLALRKDPHDMGLFPDGVEPDPSKNGLLAKRPDPKSGEGLSLKQAAHTSQFWVIGAVWILLSLTLHLVFVHLVPYAVDMGISPMDAAFILSIIGLANIIGRLIIGRLSDSMDRKRLGAICAFVQFVSFLWLLYAGELWMFYAFAVVYGFLWGGTSIVVTTLLGDIYGMRNLGIIMGGVNAGWSLGAATGPVLGGVLFDLYGHYSTAFAAGAGAILVATVLLATIRKALK